MGGNDGPNIDLFDVTLVKAAEVKPDTSKDSTEKTPVSIFAKAVPVMQHGACSVSFFDTKGTLVRRLNVEFAKIGDVAWMIRGLPAGLYIMRVKAAGAERSKFIAVK